MRPSEEEFRQMEKIPVTVVLDNIRSLNNIGSFFRTCDAFAMEHICLCGITGTPPNREIHKTALGAENSVSWSYFSRTVDAVQHLKDDGHIIIAIEQVEGATMLSDFMVDRTLRYGLVFGNEVDGVDQAVVDICDGAIEIPQIGTKHSLNVSVSGGVVLWEFFKEYSNSTI